MNSVIAIRGIGTMSISSALEKVSEMAMDVAKLGAMKDAKNVQDNLPRYMDLLGTYNESIQEAYRELAAQRKRGGTASKGIDRDISESKDQLKSTDKFTKSSKPGGKESPHPARGMLVGNKKIGEDCGNPMAPNHKSGRILLMKLYKKEMECPIGSPMHGDIMLMIKKVRDNIGLNPEVAKVCSHGCRLGIGKLCAKKGCFLKAFNLAEDVSENVIDTIRKKVKQDFAKRKQLFGKGKTA